jgi:phosphopantetheinyl transferase
MEAEPESLRVSLSQLDALAWPAVEDWLHPGEAQRLQSLQALRRRHQYLAGHWLARCLLAKAYGGEPQDWRLIERRDQAPAVQPPDGRRAAAAAPIQLGLAHSGGWLAAAVGQHRFGLDIEQRGRSLTRAAFEPLLLNPDQLGARFGDDALLARWVAKEAWIKREQGAALPSRLRQLHLFEDPAGVIRAFRGPDYLLALATPHAARFLGTEQPAVDGGWRVLDRNAPDDHPANRPGNTPAAIAKQPNSKPA